MAKQWFSVVTYPLGRIWSLSIRRSAWKYSLSLDFGDRPIGKIRLCCCVFRITNTFIPIPSKAAMAGYVSTSCLGTGERAFSKEFNDSKGIPFFPIFMCDCQGMECTCDDICFFVKERNANPSFVRMHKMIEAGMQRCVCSKPTFRKSPESYTRRLKRGLTSG